MNRSDLDISKLSPKQRRLYELMREERRREKRVRTRIPRRRNRGPAALSSGQERLWFLHRLEPESPTYNTSLVRKLSGRLQLGVLERSVADVVRRHESLRTTFSIWDGRPVQRVHRHLDLRLPVVDLRALDRQRAEALAVRMARSEADRPYNLECGPLLRLLLVRLAPRTHVVLVGMHHIITDGWSTGVFLHELFTAYRDRSRGLSPSLPELPIQYPDFAAWQHEWLHSEELKEELEHWAGVLEGAPEDLGLPTDRRRPAVWSARGGVEEMVLPRSLVRKLEELALGTKSTLFMVLLAGFLVLLQRFTGRSDLVVGTPIAGRRHRETERLIGFFVNTLVLRVDLSGAPTVTELVRRVRRVATAAYAHQDLPFERLVEELQPERDLSRNPLFHVMFAFQNAPRPEPAMEGIGVEHLPSDPPSPAVDLNLDVKHRNDRLVAKLEYRRDLFDRTTIRRWRDHLARIWRSITGAGDRTLDRVPLLSPAEAHQLRREWSGGGAPRPDRTPVDALVGRQARRLPDAVAVTDGGRAVSYAELERRASGIARRLRSDGIGAGSVVALLTGRSMHTVIGALGALKTGAAYLPMDPTQPEERRRFMVEDSGASATLRGRSWGIDLEVGGVQLPADRPRVESWNRSPKKLAYVIYTSGSTGRPKGVAVPMGGLVNLSLWHREVYGVEPDDRASMVAGPGFDAAVWELWPYLISGASLHVAPEAVRGEARELLEWLTRKRITLSFLPTPMAEQLLEQLRGEELETPDRLPLRALLTGGDRLGRPPAPSVPFPLVNHYGPTESSVVTTAGRIRPEDRTPPPIGRPIGNTEVFVLDARGFAAPLGAAGELVVGGSGLARGYVGRPSLTAESFVPDAWSGRWGSRLYRTGDLARYLPDGRIEFLGRIDHQVKVRGFRIEPGEIEGVLEGLSGVEAAVVTVRGAGSGGKRLVAYVVGTAEESSLRRALESRLPGYMVPSAFVELESVPLTANGKVDRAALPEPEWGGSADSVRSPRTPTEEVLAGVWEEVLGLERVGVDESFFELGGHSLLATQLISRLRSAFGVELALRELFEAPTVAGLSERVDAALSSGASLAAPPLRPVDRKGSLPVSFAQQRLWVLDRLEPGMASYNVPAALRLEGDLVAPWLARSLRRVVGRHESLRTRFEVRDGEPVQVVAPGARVSLPVVDLGGLPRDRRESEVRRVGRGEASRGFDLERGPLLRSTLVRLGPREHAVVLVMHHIVSDGWSMGILVREVSSVYEASSRGVRADLDDLPVQYGDFAVWQREWLRGRVLEEELSYWVERLSGAPEDLGLPTDRPRPAVWTGRGAVERVRIPEPEVRGLESLARRTGTTLFMSLLAGLSVLLARYTGRDDMVVGTPIAGRRWREVEGLIGFFVNTLVLRTRLEGSTSVDELLSRVRRTALEAYAHQDLPFERLVEELQPERALSRSALFQVMLVLQNAPRPELELPGLRLRPLDADSGTAKFDLTLSLSRDEAGLGGELRYNPDLFDRTTVRRMVGHYRRVLRRMAAVPAKDWRELELLAPVERHQTLLEWNDNGRGTEVEPVHRWIERRASRTPDAIAVSTSRCQLTYGELIGRSATLAQRLRELGAAPETPIAARLDDPEDRIVALLAVLGTGGVYTPIDPAHGHRRGRAVLEDSGAPLIIATSERELVADGSLRVSPRLSKRGDAEPGALHRSDLDCRALAYLIYTSGSTGRPKGVAVDHGALANRLSWSAERHPLEQGDRVLQQTSAAFDFSLWEILAPLAAGACVVAVPPDGAMDPRVLVDLVRRERVTVAHFVPAVLGGVLDTPGLSLCRSLRLVYSGGEALPAGFRERLLDQLDVTMVNQYGPTEATIDATSETCDSGDRFSGTTVPIGRPINNLEALVLGADLRPVPHGAPGELCLAGAGLARGYWDLPGQTAEVFVPRPGAGRSGWRLYRTGDRVRQLSDGRIEFLGRLDRQIQVRGFRIEPGEVEAAIGEHPAVSRAVVDLHRGGPDGEDQALVVYVVRKSGETISPRAIRKAAAERLPAQMVPSSVVELESLPLAESGKVDRMALPSPSSGESGSHKDSLQPRDALELRLVGIWEATLGRSPIGVREDFFELGGHSLRAVRLLGRIREELGRELRLASLFEGPTIEEQATLLRSMGAEDRGREEEILIPMQSGGGDPPFFCIHPVGGGVICYAELARCWPEGSALYALSTPEQSGGASTIEELAERYLDEVRRVRPQGPYRLGGWSMGGVIAYEMARQLEARDETVERLVLIDSHLPVRDSRDAPEDDLGPVRAFARDLGGVLGVNMPLEPGELEGLAPTEVLDHLLEKADRLGLVPPDLDQDRLRALYRRFESNSRALRRYRPGRYGGRVLLLRASRTPSNVPDPVFRWRELVGDRLTVHEIPGDHYSILRGAGARRIVWSAAV